MARFVRLAEQSEVDAEHLHAPTVVATPGGTRLGYGPGRQEALAEQREQLLVSAPSNRSLVRPIVEGALGLCLLMILMGALSDMSGSATQGRGLMGGAVMSAMVVFLGFQGVRSASPALLLCYALATVLLLGAGLLLGLAGVVPHAALHVGGIVMAIASVRTNLDRRFVV